MEVASFKLLLLYPWRCNFQYPFDGKLMLCRREKSLALAQNRIPALQLVALATDLSRDAELYTTEHAWYVFIEHYPAEKPIATARYGGREVVNTVF
jgi:hypothetical protein